MKNVTLVCRAYATSDVEIEESYPVYVVPLEESLVKEWVKKIQTTARLSEEHRDLYCLTYWGLPGDFMDLGKLDSEVEGVQDLLDRLDEGEDVIQVPGDSKLAKILNDAAENTTWDGGARIRTECRRVEATNNAVVANAAIKHTSISLESVEVRLTLLMDLLLEKAA